MIHLTHILFASLLCKASSTAATKKLLESWNSPNENKKAGFQIDASERMHVASFHVYLSAFAVWETEGTY